MSSSSTFSLAFGLASSNSNGDIIEVYYPQPILKPSAGLVDTVSSACTIEKESNSSKLISKDEAAELSKALTQSGESETAAIIDKLGSAKQQLIVCLLAKDLAPTSIAEAFLKLHLLSHRLVKPHQVNLDGIFGVLDNLAWTSEGAVDLNDLPARQLDARLQGKVLEVMSIDKFPKMTNYVVPKGVRIAHTARVRLGAYIGEGTTVMHEGFVNFNAGTEGPAMIEGRISAGVMIGENSDLGGGCSTMGTLSGGGKEIISVGKNCLIGANAGIGIPLADGCIVEAGLYVTAGTKLNVIDSNGSLVETVKAMELVGRENLLYRRNSLSGAVECVPLKNSISLNEELHTHN